MAKALGVGQQVEVAQQDAVLNLHRIHLREHYYARSPAARGRGWTTSARGR